MDGCKYCNEDISDSGVSKDIFFEWLKVNPFGIETDNFNPDLSVFITNNAELELNVMLGDYDVLNKKQEIKYCPFCGRRLREC